MHVLLCSGSRGAVHVQRLVGAADGGFVIHDVAGGAAAEEGARLVHWRRARRAQHVLYVSHDAVDRHCTNNKHTVPYIRYKSNSTFILLAARYDEIGVLLGRQAEVLVGGLDEAHVLVQDGVQRAAALLQVAADCRQVVSVACEGRHGRSRGRTAALEARVVVDGDEDLHVVELAPALLPQHHDALDEHDVDLAVLAYHLALVRHPAGEKSLNYK